VIFALAAAADRLDPSVDGVHMTDAGYARWREAIERCVREEC
jgi:lysophospholipase L1-like esterase